MTSQNGFNKHSLEESSPFQRNNSNRWTFTAIYLGANVFGITALSLMGVWLKKYSGGFSWTTEKFNYHPFLMTVFFFLYGNGMLTYRLMRNQPKPTLKLIHAGLNGAAGIIAMVGLIIPFYLRKGTPAPNLYSLHSWIGFGAFLLYEANWFVGCVSFFLPTVSLQIRSFVLPFHVFGGKALIALITTAILTGTVEKGAWARYPPKLGYSDLPPQALTFNFYGITIIAFALIIGFLVTYLPFKRHPLPSEVNPNNNNVTFSTSTTTTTTTFSQGIPIH